MIKNETRLSVIIYRIAFLLYTFSYIVFSTSNINQILNIQFIVSLFNFLILICLMLVIMSRSKPIALWIVTLVLIIIGVVVYLGSSDSTFLFLILFSLAYDSKIDNYLILKSDFKIRIIAISLIIVLSVLNVIPNNGSLRLLSGGFVRSSLGFTHPNVLGAVILSAIAEWIYIRKSKITKYELILLFMILYLVNVVANPRSAIVSGVILVFMTLIIRIPFNLWLTKVIKLKIVSFSYFVGFVTSLFFALNFVAGNGLGIWDRINKLLSGRLGIAQFYLNNTSSSLFPQRLPTYELTGLTVLDNTYIYLYLHLGIIALVVFLIFTIVKGNKLIKSNDLFGIIIFISLSVFGLMESTAFYPAINFILIIQSSINEEKSINDRFKK